MIRAAATAAFFAAFLASGAALADEVMVHVGHGSIHPAEIKLKAGDSVVFHNMDEMPGGHTVVVDDGSHQSPPLAKDEKWKHTFEKPGSYGVHVKEHPDAKAKVFVE